MLSLKVTTVGGFLGINLTKEALATLKIKQDDTVFLTEAPGGGYRLTLYNADFERQMTLAEDIIRDDREILRALSK